MTSVSYSAAGRPINGTGRKHGVTRCPIAAIWAKCKVGGPLPPLTANTVTCWAYGDADRYRGDKGVTRRHGEVAGCEFVEAAGFLSAGGLGGLVTIILQAAGLAPPIAVMLVLGGFGQAFLRGIGGHPILKAVVTIVVLLLVTTLLNSLIPYVQDAFAAVDGDRWLMFDEGLGSVSTIVSRFWGVILVAGLIMISWEVVGSMRSGSALEGRGQRM